MPIKRSEILTIRNRTEKVIYDFLKNDRDKLFSLNEIMEVLREKGVKDVISSHANFEERCALASVALEILIDKHKVEKFNHRGEYYFGVK